MPRVPTYQRQATRTSKLNIPSSTALKLPDNSRQMNQVYNASIKAVGDIANEREKSQVKADNIVLTTAKNDYDNNMKSLKMSIEKDYKGKKAGAAIGAFETASKKINEDMNSRFTDRQKEQWQNYAPSRNTAHELGIHQYVNNENEKQVVTTSKARVELLRQDSAENPYDVKKLKDNLTQQNMEIDSLALMKGMSADQVKLAKLESNSATHSSVITAMANQNNDIVAKKYFAAIEKDMTTEDRERARNLLEVSSTLGEAQRLSNDMIEDGANPEDAVAYILDKTKDNPKLQEVAVAKYKRRFEENRRFKSYKDSDSFTDLFNQAREGGSIDQIDKNQLAELTPARQKTVLEMFTKKPRTTSDLTKYSDWKTIAYDTKTRDKFLLTDTSEFIKHLKPSDAQDMIDLQIKLRNKDIDEDEASGFLTQTAMVNKSMDELGLEDKVPRGRFNKYVQEEVTKWSEENKKPGNKIPDKDFQEIIDKGVIKGEVMGGGFLHDPNKKFFQLKTDEEIARFASDNEDEDAAVDKQRKISQLKIDLRKKLNDQNRSFDEDYINEVVKKVLSLK